jgi:hypothetical protein
MAPATSHGAWSGFTAATPRSTAAASPPLAPAVQRREEAVGAIGEEDLEESEWHALRRLDLITPRPVVERPRWRRAAAWLGTRSGRFTARTLTFGVWMLLGVMILVSEFLRYSGGGGGAPGRGWWNQPMIQVPWMNWTPGHLREKEPSEP